MLQSTLERFNFVVQVHQCATKAETLDILEGLKSLDMSDCDFFGMVVTSCGGKGGLVKLEGEQMTLADFMEPINANETLTAKPKVRSKS